jgi:hypothetical protein
MIVMFRLRFCGSREEKPRENKKGCQSGFRHPYIRDGVHLVGSLAFVRPSLDAD